MSKTHITPVIVAAAAALVIGTLGPVASAHAQNENKLSEILSGLAKGLEAEQQDQAIKRAFKDALDREPSSSELRRYRTLMHEEHWAERDVRNDLRSRSDYRRHSSQQSIDPDRVIRRAYEDILNREPDEQGLRNYRRLIIDQGWTEQDVRQALRKSQEHAAISQDSADRIVRRAYQDILSREPDYSGLVNYRNQIMHHGWDEHDVRAALQQSPEFRQKNAMTRDKAEDIVRRAYLSVLHREPDAAGMESYVQGVLKQHWNESEIARDLRNSDEYRSKHR
jgi:TorA maturation chaperone TorD